MREEYIKTEECKKREILKPIKGKKSHDADAAELKNYIGEKVWLHGSIYKIRKMSNFAFVLLRTRERIVQCVYGEEFSRFEADRLKEEACVKVYAEVVAEERSKVGFELHLLDYRPITLRNEKERAIFRIQAAICQGFREFLQQEKFTEIHTPKIVALGAEGGANIFRLPYFEKEAYLAQSPQFYKQMMVGVFERVYEIAPVFRAEKHDTSRHLNEYTSVDMEMGYIESFEEIMETELEMLRFTMQFLMENRAYELELLQVEMPDLNHVPQIRFEEAKQLIAKRHNRPVKAVPDFEPEEEKLLGECIKEKTGNT